MQLNLGEMEMLEMRVLFAVLPVALGIAGISAAGAADLPIDRPVNYFTLPGGVGYRAEPLMVVDYQPDVIISAYWLAPWRNRHYYPRTGTMPEIGRDEDLSAVSSPPQSAESFHRYWSSSSAFLPEEPSHRAPRYVNPDPLPDQALQAPL